MGFASSCSIQYPIDGGSSYSKTTNNLDRTHAVSMQIEHCIRFCPSGWRASLVLSFCLGFGYPFTLPFQHQFPLELGDTSKQMEQQFSGRSCCIQIEPENPKGSPLFIDGSLDSKKVGNRSCQAIQFGHYEHVSLANIIKGTLKLFSVCDGRNPF